MKVINTKELTDELWEKYFEFYQKLYSKFYPDLIFTPNNWKQFKEQRLHEINNLQNDKYKEFSLLEQDEMVGWFDRFLTPLNIIFGFDTIYTDLPDEIYKIIFRELLNFMCDKNKTEVCCWSYDERKLNQMVKPGPEKVEDYPISALLKENIDVKLLRKFIDDFENRFENKISFLKKFPANLFEKYSRLVKPIYEELLKINPVLKNLNIVITDDDMKETFSLNENLSYTTNYYFIMWNENEEMIALHQVIIKNNDPKTIRCNGGFTCVRNDNRGKGIGKYLKSKMILYLFENNPDFKMITSDTMPWNKHMFRINEELGFKPFKTGARFRFTKEFLENYLNK